ncbi:MAG TPA: glycosyltransferase [Cytophagaceae bacterium]
MKIVMIYEELVTSSNNKKGHFLTGMLRELYERGHQVIVFETTSGKKKERVSSDIINFYSSFDIRQFSGDLEELETAGLIIADSRIEIPIIENIGRIGLSIKLLHDVSRFLDSNPESVLSGFHGILADSISIKAAYRNTGFKNHIWVLEEAIDFRIFYPRKAPLNIEKRDVLLFANEGGKREIFQETMQVLTRGGYSVTILGDGYGQSTRIGQMDFKGWIPYFQLPYYIAAHRFSIHLPSPEPDAMHLRFLESFAGGIPLISIGDNPKAYFSNNRDFVYVEDFKNLSDTLKFMTRFPVHIQSIVSNGLRVVNRYHTCFHRLNLLEEILQSFGVDKAQIIPENKWSWKNTDGGNELFRYRLGS